MSARTCKPAATAIQSGAPALTSAPAIVLTPEEATLLRLFRGTRDEERRIVFSMVKVTAETFPRHTGPGLRLVVGGAA